MHRRVLDSRRRRTPEPIPDDELLARVEAAWRDDAHTVDPEVVLGRAEVQAELRDALVHLPVILRSAVVLHDRQGLTSLEVALASCPTCPGLYTSIVGVSAAVGRLRDPDSVVPPDIAHRLTSGAVAQELPVSP